MRWAWLTVLFFFCLPVLADDRAPLRRRRPR